MALVLGTLPLGLSDLDTRGNRAVCERVLDDDVRMFRVPWQYPLNLYLPGEAESIPAQLMKVIALVDILCTFHQSGWTSFNVLGTIQRLEADL